MVKSVLVPTVTRGWNPSRDRYMSHRQPSDHVEAQPFPDGTVEALQASQGPGAGMGEAGARPPEARVSIRSVRGSISRFPRSLQMGVIFLGQPTPQALCYLLPKEHLVLGSSSFLSSNSVRPPPLPRTGVTRRSG